MLHVMASAANTNKTNSEKNQPNSDKTQPIEVSLMGTLGRPFV
jgi:hypothetical protein